MFAAFVLIFIVAALAYRKRKLTKTGAFVAAIIASCIAVAFSYKGLFLLGTFFFSANALSFFKRKEHPAVSAIVAKGDCRDNMQVIANGGIPALLSILYIFFPSPALYCGFVASLAAVTADTWASEIGTMFKQKPFHLWKWKRVPPGTSGAITLFGTIAALAGSFVISAIAIGLSAELFHQSAALLIAFTIAGFLGNVFDTVVGARFQVVYRCSVCGLETERRMHCQRKTVHVSGVHWIDNDVVNLGCSIVGAILGISIAAFF